jgi:hypothetical protein
MHALTDGAVVLWVALWVRVGFWVRDLIDVLSRPADRVGDAGSRLDRDLTSLASAVGDIPLVGARIRAPVESMRTPAREMTRMSSDLATSIHHLATVVGVLVALIPIVLVVGTWLFLRVRFVRRARAAAAFIDADADLDLFALRAMANQPMHRLARITPDPAGAWRNRDPAVLRALAALELRDTGLRVPDTFVDTATDVSPTA